MERDEIEILKGKRYSLEDIAKALGRVKSGIWYELQKAVKGRRYRAEDAERKTYLRRRSGRKEGKKIAHDRELRSFVEEHLMDDQSPDAIAGRLKQVERKLKTASARAIRRYIGSVYGRNIESHRKKVFKKRRKRHGSRERLEGKRMIDKRPSKINKRWGLGHMEGDFIVSGRSGKGLLLVLIDRNCRKALFERILPVSVKDVERALVRMKSRFPEMQTITFDNDLLFLEHKRLEKVLRVRIYFCHPRAPWEKPSVENVNRWIRRYVPKSSDISRYTRPFFAKLEEKANRRFMECLGFRTPEEAYERARKRKSARRGVGSRRSN
jgi:IS30 family transposase